MTPTTLLLDLKAALEVAIHHAERAQKHGGAATGYTAGQVIHSLRDSLREVEAQLVCMDLDD